MRRLQVKSSAGEYKVIVGRGAWRALQRLKGYSSVFVLTELSLWERWGNKLLCDAGWAGLPSILVPSGESSKSLSMAGYVASELLECGADRRSLLVAFGGGVVGDLGGFVASTYMRGIDYVQAPTTVLAQVDSALGGKTAVNVGAMKNLVGTFYAPRMVVSDPAVLASLLPRAFQSGLYETVKHAILSGPALFGWLEGKVAGLRPGDTPLLETLVARAAQVKVDVVSRDEREAGLRRVLNLGHTYGHALEEATGYRRFLHGEAVAWGMLIVTRLAELASVLDPAVGKRIARVVRSVGPLPGIRGLNEEKILGLLPRDKKAVGGKIHWVLPEGLGKVRVTPDVPDAAVARAFCDVQRGEWNG
ncbi:MAG: 3-dehydroquinate synthase [Terriglobia bacterium]|jgi:3-dehydroquinate synthase